MRLKTLISLSLICLTQLTHAQDNAPTQEPTPTQVLPRSRVIIVGNIDNILIGQEGYCGKMERVGRDEIQKITVPSSKRTWLRLINGGRASGSTCSLDSSFIPEPGQAYIVRYAELGRRCQVELFRIKPGLAPVRETLVREESRSCLFQ